MPRMASIPLNAPSGNPHRTGAYEPRPPRIRTCLNGKVVYGEGAYSIDCAIRDLSDGGAKINLPQRQFLPVDLYLIVVRNCVAHEAKVVWMNFPSRGLRFSRTYSLSGVLPEEVKFLRKLWGDLYARCGWDTMT